MPYKAKCGKCGKRFLKTDELPEQASLHHRDYPEKLEVLFVGSSPPLEDGVTSPELEWMNRAFKFDDTSLSDHLLVIKLRCKKCELEVGKFKLWADVVDGCYAKIKFKRPGQRVILRRI